MRDELDYNQTMQLDPSQFNIAARLVCLSDACSGLDLRQYFSLYAIQLDYIINSYNQTEIPMSKEACYTNDFQVY